MSSHEYADDPIAARLTTIAQYILVITFGLLPIFFVPSVIAPFGYSKVVFVILGTFLALILYSFALLRTGMITTRLSWAPAILWVVTLIALVSAFLSGDFRDAFIGEMFEVHTTVFVALLALTATVWMLLATNKTVIMRLFMLIAGSTIVLSLFHILRLVFGSDFLSLWLFGGDPTLSPFGGWNDLGIFFGLAIILSLVALEQLRLTPAGKALFGLVVLVALIMLSVINFFAVWVVLGLLSLAILTYSLTKERFGRHRSAEKKTQVSTMSIYISLVVFIVSVVFLLGGGVVGNAITNMTSISYLEVRPSFGTTVDIVKHVYERDALFGVGPNHFGDVWRQFKDPTINDSIFWNTEFVAGFGYIPTFFATMGILGGLAWIAFLVLFVISGLRMLLGATTHDRLWYFIGTTSFVGGLYIWAISLMYVPGPVLLIIAALCTGLMGAASHALAGGEVRKIDSYQDRRIGFVLVVVFLIVIMGSVSALYFVGRHYVAVYVFNSVNGLIAQGASLDELEARTISAYTLSSDDAFARRLAEYQLARVQNLLSVAEPTDQQKQEFTGALQGAINAAQVAINGDPTDPRNINLLGNVYALLVPAKVEGSYDKAVETFKKVQELDPRNPIHRLTLAQLAFSAGRTDEARKYVDEALALKSNYSDAIFALVQMDIAAGNVDAAIQHANAVTTLEPDNAVRYFQLGVLFLSVDRRAEAVATLERAVALDQNYANARFYLALTYDAMGQKDKAREQLNAILTTNPGNELVLNLLKRLDNNQPLFEAQTGESPIAEPEGVQTEDGAVTASSTPDTTLVTPVNTPPTPEEETEEVPPAVPVQ